jgi:hypothetical protein
MPRTATPFENETFAQFLTRLGIEVDEFYNLNPNFNAEAYVAGTPFSVPDTAQVFAKPPVVAPATSEAAPVPQASVAPSDTPSGVLAGGAQGLFEQMLKDFRSAFKTYLSAPNFIKNLDTATAGAKAGKGAGPGWTTQEAEFLRQNEDIYESRFDEQVQRQFAETGELPTLTAADFLKTVNPRTDMEMRSNEARGNRGRVPSTGVRRLRF